MSVSQVVGLCLILLSFILITVFNIIIIISDFRVYKRIVGKKKFISYFFGDNIIRFYVTDSNLEKLKKSSKKYNVDMSQIINDMLTTYED